MSSLKRRTNQSLPLSILVLGLASCKTDLGPPAISALKYSNVGPVAMAAPSQLTIFSKDKSAKYTIDITARQLRYSTGQVVDLTDGQTNGIYAAFQRIIATDPVADSLGSLTYSNIRVRYSPLMSSLQVTGTLTLNFSERGTLSALSSLKARLGDPCTDIVTSAALAKLNYTSRRTRAFDEILAAGIAEVGSAIGAVVFPEGTAAGAALNSTLLENLTTTSQVDIMAFYWNSYSCGTKHVTSAPIYHPAPAGLGTGGWVCATEAAKISFNGGPWYQVFVTVCQETQ